MTAKQMYIKSRTILKAVEKMIREGEKQKKISEGFGIFQDVYALSCNKYQEEREVNQPRKKITMVEVPAQKQKKTRKKKSKTKTLSLDFDNSNKMEAKYS